MTPKQQQISIRKDGSYNNLYCSGCGIEHKTNMMSNWIVDGCLECGTSFIYCSKECRKESSQSHWDKCKDYKQ